jgi:TldD protein
MKRTIAVALVTVLSPLWVWAEDTVAREMQQDVLLRALVDELARNQNGLVLEGLQRPYFLEYALLDTAQAGVSADLGSVAERTTNHTRSLRSEVRVGSYVLDNTNFSGGVGRGGGASLPIENDYNAIRQAIWWSTDRQYKQVVEAFEKKKAFMESKMIEDKPDDFSREPPTVFFEERNEVAIDVVPLEKIAVTLSAIFQDFPAIQNSHVAVQGGIGNKYLVNTEGTRLRTAGSRFSVSVAATVQCDDGMELSDSLALQAKKFQDLPSLEEMSRRCRQMIDRLIAVKNAPKLEAYSGPVLFEPEAAAAIFSQMLASRFAGGQRPVGSTTDPEDFEKKLDRRILPRFMDVRDDPTQETVAGQYVLAHYQYDDQGVPAQPVTLVDHGRLKALLMSRNPSKVLKSSNGHGRGFRPSASVGCLMVTSSDPLDGKALKQEMLEACADEGLEYGLRIAALGSVGDGGGGLGGYRQFFGGYDGDGGGSAPLATYKVYPDGREELVRGAELGNIDLKAFKRMLAAGDQPYVFNTTGRGSSATVSVPALLFEELDLAKVDRDFDKPPILPNPLARSREN